MKLIKLSAIDSTNDFLKELSKNETLENFTTVVAEQQLKGKGQMGSSWVTEKGKNLIMSTLIKDVVTNVDQVFHLNVAVSIAIIQVLETLNIPSLSIKWPNDIMSDGKKIAGILIENRFKSNTTIESVVGIGLNVNQKDYSSLPKASSMSIVANIEFDIDLILEEFIAKIQANCNYISKNATEKLWTIYLENLFKKGLLMSFEDQHKSVFNGTILGVTHEGKLEVAHQDKTIHYYGIKEITLLY
jgi:BirA family biotin operon repressor/biotin-[acetyl-CoA-carboxylase] ligase